MSPTPAPTLTTDRLVLRGPEARDLAAFVDFFARSPRNRHNRFDDAGAWRLFAAVIGHWHLRGWGMWTLATPDDTPAGLVGCLQFAEWPEPEIAWFVWDGFEGRGFATEAARAARTCAYGRFGWTTAVSYIDADNAASVRVAEKLGARIEPGAPHPGTDPTLVWRHPAPTETP